MRPKRNWTHRPGHPICILFFFHFSVSVSFTLSQPISFAHIQLLQFEYNKCKRIIWIEFFNFVCYFYSVQNVIYVVYVYIVCELCARVCVIHISRGHILEKQQHRKKGKQNKKKNCALSFCAKHLYVNSLYPCSRNYGNANLRVEYINNRESPVKISKCKWAHFSPIILIWTLNTLGTYLECSGIWDLLVLDYLYRGIQFYSWDIYHIVYQCWK